VVEWFKKTNAQMVKTYGRHVPSVAFFHIPIYAVSAFQKSGVDEHKQPGINHDNPLDTQSGAYAQGSDGTTITYGGQDIPFMEALLDTHKLLAVFSGHDHGVDWCVYSHFFGK
jgi:hypothetical protein